MGVDQHQGSEAVRVDTLREAVIAFFPLSIDLIYARHPVVKVPSVPETITDTPIREPISKKLRFEIFKRDSFRCQYCGKSAPEVVLEIDHVDPVAGGGKSDILNLLTACNPCNAGKGKRLLSDSIAVTKQMDQLKELNERREQLDMLIQWKAELSNLKEESLAKVGDYWTQHAGGYSLNESGLRNLKKLLNRFELQEVLDAIQISTDQYLTYDKKDKVEFKSVQLAWSKVSGICQIRRAEQKKPYLSQLFYIRGILRKRFAYVNEQLVMDLLESAVKSGMDVEDLTGLAKRSWNWKSFQAEVEDRIDKLA
jgi:5-methylcytosine-specific restriction endonuclease McrA